MNPLITIGLGTRDRLKMLAHVLESLVYLRLPVAAEVELIVCDNGKDETAESIFNQFENRFPFKSFFVKESKMGIVFMRNRILETAIQHNAKFLAFLDDDEVADSLWLQKLFETLHRFSASVVQGHVEQRFPAELSDLNLLKRFFPGSFSKNTGDELHEAYTNNVLVDLSLVREHKLRFNERFNLTGGSDSLFFSQLKEKGARIVFCKEAIVTESVPASRATMEWVLFRFYRNGYTKYYMDLVRFGLIKAWINGVKMIYSAFVTCIISSRSIGPPQSEEDVLYLKKCLRAKGTFHAMIGKSLIEYDITHGS